MPGRPRKIRPTFETLWQEGPPLSPMDLALIVGIRRDIIADMCADKEIVALQYRTHWRITRPSARAFCERIGLRRPAA